MFSHAYDSYLDNAWGTDVLAPITCKGEDGWGGIALTLLDTLDSLAIMGNASEFERGVRYVVERVDFDKDETVSLFETNIRALGGLLAAHAFASDPSLGLLARPYPRGYRGAHGDGLLPLAVDLADRLMPALDTQSGIPYGSVNLRRGVAATESPVACTAAAGTLVMEFGALSRLTGNGSYEAAAKRAALAVWRRRSEIDLVGAHVHLKSGAWTQADAGIGRSIDSFYEYMLKGFMLLKDSDYLAVFHDSYHAALKHLKHGPWYLDVHLQTAQVTWPLFNSLQCFWPGMQMLIGELDQAVETLRAFHALWRHLGFHPEGFNLASMQVQAGQKGYPLRPEHAESLFWAHRSLSSQGLQAHEWIHAGVDVIHSLERLRLPCGYAAVGDVMNGTLEDKMESFYLSETLKYLYLLFDPDDEFYLHGKYVFTTEAHPLPLDLKSIGARASAVQATASLSLAAADAVDAAEAAEADNDDDDGAMRAAAEAAEATAAEAAERAEEYDIACALAQLQGLPHPDDEYDPFATADMRNAAAMEAEAEAAAEASGAPRLVGSCAIPSAKVRALLPTLDPTKSGWRPEQARPPAAEAARVWLPGLRLPGVCVFPSPPLPACPPACLPGLR